MKTITLTISDEHAERIAAYLKNGWKFGNWIDFQMHTKTKGSWLGEPHDWRTTTMMGGPARFKLTDHSPVTESAQ